MTTKRLHELQPGQSASVLRIDGHSALRRRFVEMGIVKGEKVFVERVAPLGDPIAYRIKGYCLSLRRTEAANIQVVLED